MSIVVTKNNMEQPTKLKCKGWHGPCDREDAKRGHMNTRYVDIECNYATLCPDCWKECDEHWEDMWAEVYSQCM
jgi:hypothetical protein